MFAGHPDTSRATASGSGFASTLDLRARPGRKTGRGLVLVCAAMAALALGGCFNRGPTATGSIDPSAMQQASESDWRRQAETLGERHARDPEDPRIAIAYAQALRRLDQRAQAVAVLQKVALRNPDDQELLGAYGRALADVGRFEEADKVLARAHRPASPDWRVLSAQGTVADQLGDHERARGYYRAALRIQPDAPSVLSNYGLSLALAGDLKQAETQLRRASENPAADSRVRQNLALVLGLQGRFSEAEDMLARDLPEEEVQEAVAALRGMITEQNNWAAIRRTESGS